MHLAHKDRGRSVLGAQLAAQPRQGGQGSPGDRGEVDLTLSDMVAQRVAAGATPQVIEIAVKALEAVREAEVKARREKERLKKVAQRKRVPGTSTGLPGDKTGTGEGRGCPTGWRSIGNWPTSSKG